MIIGVPKEIKANENRVSVTPAGVLSLVAKGHQVLVESSAGEGSGIRNDEYKIAGAEIIETNKEVFARADMIMKVKEPLPPEYTLLKEGQILFTFLHLAPEPFLTKALLDKKVVGIAYETVQLSDGSLPLLHPMSEVAGRMSVQIGCRLLEKIFCGKGVLLGGVPGVLPAEVVIIGGDVVGTNAAKMALGMGARVTILDINPQRLAHLDDLFGGRVTTLMSNEYNIAAMVRRADLLIGGVLIPGRKAPRLVSEDMVRTMEPGSVIVDVAIDQGGSIETIDRITTHENPYYLKHDVVHYSVANMPGAVPRTSTFALTNVTLPYGLMLANLGYEKALKTNVPLSKGLNVYFGQVTNQGVADALGLAYIPVDQVLYG